MSSSTNQATGWLPHNHAAIVEMADELHHDQVVEDLHHHFRAGVFLNNKTMRFWTDPSSLKNSFMLYAKSLSILQGDDSKVWRYARLDDDIEVEVAQLLEAVIPVEVKGKFEMNHFTPKSKYEVLFLLMMKNNNEIEPNFVTLKLELPNGMKMEKTQSLKGVATDHWVEVKVGEFVATAEEGDIVFSMMNTDEGAAAAAQWKKGLIVEGVLIQPCMY